MTDQANQFQERNSGHWGSAPLLAPALALIAGILLDRFCEWGIWVWIAATCLAAAAFPLLCRRTMFSLIALLLMALSLGGWLHHLRYNRFAPDHIIRYVSDISVLAQLRGNVLTSPIITTGGLKRFEQYRFRDGGTAFVLDATEIHCASKWRPCSGMLWVRIAAPTRMLQQGDRLELGGWLMRPGGPRNPGGFNWAKHNRRQRILAGLQVPVVEAIRRLDSGGANPSGGGRSKTLAAVLLTSVDWKYWPRRR